MIKEELNLALLQVEIDANNKKMNLYQEYANKNAIAKIGDIVTNGGSIIRVEKILYSLLSQNIYYSGLILKKDLKERKIHEIGSVSELSSFKILKKAGE